MLKDIVDSRLRDNDSGAVAVIVAIMAVMLFGMAAFAVDMGVGWASERDLSVTSDAAALAGAQAAGVQLQTLYPTGTSCDSAVVGTLATAATTAATDVYDAQRPNGSEDPTVTVECVGTEAIDVVVEATAAHDTVFASIFGVDTLYPSAAATARVSGSEAYGGLRPFAVCDDSVVRGDQTLTQQSLYLNNPPGNDTKPGVECGPLGAGNWGIVDFDGGNNANTDIATWTRYGYNDPVAIPDPAMPGDPGADTSAPVKSALDTLEGKIIYLPLANSWNDGNGNNASFYMSGVMAVEICGYWDKNGGQSEPEAWGCWDSTLVDPEAPGYDPAVDEADLILQWQWRPAAASYFPGGADAAECSLSDPNCLPAVQLYR